MVGLHFLYKVLKDRRGDVLLKVNPKWFILPKEMKLYHKVQDFVIKYGVLPSLANGDAPEGFEDNPVEYYLHELRKRYLVHALTKLRQTEVDSENVENVINRFLQDISSSTIVKEGIVTEQEIQQVIQKVVDETRIRRVAGHYGLPTGYPSLDAVTGGYLYGDVFVYVARLKMGKTIVMLNSMRKLAKEHRCLFISMEMSLNAIIRRLVFLETGISNVIDPSRIVSSFVDEQIKQINYKLTLVNGSTLNDVRDVASLISFYSPEAVFIDGAYLIPCAQRYKAEWEKAKYIIEELRRISLSSNVPIICTYQLNRQALKAKTLGAEHVALTDAIGQSASCIVAIVQGEMHNEREMVVLANREGMSDVRGRIHFDWRTGNFEEIMDNVIVYEEE